MAPQRPHGADASLHMIDGPAQDQPGSRPLYAAIDLGTNSCRMLIAQPQGSKFQVIDSFSKSVQLGIGLESSGRLSRGSISKAIQALKVCRQKINDHGINRMRLVATEACRRAENGQYFVSRVQNETGLRLEVITPEEEAWLTVVSCAPLVDKATKQLLVVDIGGGSTELVWIDLSEVPVADRTQSVMNLRRRFDRNKEHPGRAKVVDWISVPTGGATLHEQFSDVQDDSARFALMSCHFEETLAAFAPASMAQSREAFQIIGTSGAITTVAASHLRLRRYDRTRVDGMIMNSYQIEKIINWYLSMGPVGRLRDPRIGCDRQAMIMSGAAILQALIRLWPTDKFSVADRSLREGLLYSQMSADGVLSKVVRSA